MLESMVGNKPIPTLEILGQIADALGLNAVLMQRIPSSHLGRISLPAVLEFQKLKELYWPPAQSVAVSG